MSGQKRLLALTGLLMSIALFALAASVAAQKAVEYVAVMPSAFSTDTPQTVAVSPLDSNKAVVSAMLEALNGTDKPLEVQEQFISSQAFKDHIALIEAAFPHYELIVEDMIADGDKVALHGTVRGRHGGEFLGLAPTGRWVEMPVVAIYRIENGRIAEFWAQGDTLALMQQLEAP